MEESIGILQAIRGVFGCRGQDIRTYSPLTLAYIGDAVYDLVIRSVIVERGNRSNNDLHKTAIRYVSAPAQAGMIGALLEELTEEERSISGGGTQSPTPPPKMPVTTSTRRPRAMRRFWDICI